MWGSRGWDGTGFFFMVGVVASLVLWLALPPVMIAGITWLILPRFGVDLPYWQLAALAGGFWVGVNLAGWLWTKWVDWRRAVANRRYHEEFMKLRKRFYKDNEVCGETLASLKARAAMEDGKTGL